MFFILDLIARVAVAITYLVGDIIGFLGNLENRFGGNRIFKRFGLDD